MSWHFRSEYIIIERVDYRGKIVDCRHAIC